MMRHAASTALLAGTFLATPALAQQQSCDQRLQTLEQQVGQSSLSSQQQGEVDQMLESARLFQRIQREEGCLNVLAEVERMLPAQQQAQGGQQQAQGGQQQAQQQQQAAGGSEDPLARAQQALQQRLGQQQGAAGGEQRPVVVIRLPRPEITVRMPGSDQEVQAEVLFELADPSMAAGQAQPQAATGGQGQASPAGAGGDQQPATVGDRQPPAQVSGGQQTTAGGAPAGDGQQQTAGSSPGGGQGQAPAAATAEQRPDRGAPAAEETLQSPQQAPDQVAQSEGQEGEADMAGDQDVQSAQQGGGEQQQEQTGDRVAPGQGGAANVQGGVTGAGDNPPAAAAGQSEAAQTPPSAQQQQVGAGAGTRQDGQDQPVAAAMDQDRPAHQGETGGGLRADAQQPDDSQSDQAAGPARLAGREVGQVIGEEVENANGETVGTVVDLVRQSSDQALFAVLSVGGFLGIGDKDVAIPAEQFEVGADQNLMLPDATEASLEEAPPFNHALYESVIEQR